MTNIFRRQTGSSTPARPAHGAVEPDPRPRHRRIGTAGGFLLATTLALTGCAATAPGAPAPSGSSVGSATATPAATAVAACPDSDAQGPWGDVIAKEQLTDAAGSYCHTTIDPASAGGRFDPTVVDLDSLAAYGFTIDDAEAAQRAALLYVAEEGLDSTVLDDTAVTDTAWFESAAPWFTAAARTALAPQVADYGLRDAGVLFSQSLPSPISRDGGPRATDTTIGVDKIFATLSVDQQTPLLLVRTKFAANYPATDAAIVDAAIRDERGTANLSEASLQASTPTLFDGVDDEGLVLAGGFNVGFATGDLTAIEYIGTAWTLTTGDGSLQIDAVEPELDPSLR